MADEIIYDPNQTAVLNYSDGERNYNIESCQESLRQMYDRALEYQGIREFSISRDGVSHVAQTGNVNADSAGSGTGSTSQKIGRLPKEAITEALGKDDIGMPTGLDDEIRDVIDDALGKARDELQKVLADGLQITIEKTSNGGFDIKAQSLNQTGTPTGTDLDELVQVEILPKTCGEGSSQHLVTQPHEHEPKRSVSVGVANPATDDDGSVSTFIPSAKSDSEAIGLIAVSTAVAINAPLISIQVTS